MSRERIDVSSFETASQLWQVDLMLIDSLVELRPRDTVTRVRYVRASTKAKESREAAATQTVTDSVASVESEIVVSPIAAESIKNGVTGLRPLCVLGDILVFAFFLWLFIVCLKKCLHLRLK